MRPISCLLTFMAVGLSAATPEPNALKRSPEPKLENGRYIVDRDIQFSKKVVWNFAGLRSLPAGLSVSNYAPDDLHAFTPSNVAVRDGYLQLTVPGGQKKPPYKSAEVVTTIENIKYASVRTVAILSQPPGVCNGMFFYHSDTQETDIEWLSDPASESNGGAPKLWFTNQDADGNGHDTHKAVSPPSRPTSTEHEYRIDWTPGLVRFYIDGVKTWETKKDVPSIPGPWIWNNWSNGDKGWSAGPPKKDAVFKIKKIEMYYNTAK